MKIFIALIMAAIVAVMGLTVVQLNEKVATDVDGDLSNSFYSMPLSSTASSIIYPNADLTDIASTNAYADPGHIPALDHHQSIMPDTRSSAGHSNNNEDRRLPSAQQVKASGAHFNDLGHYHW